MILTRLATTSDAAAIAAGIARLLADRGTRWPTVVERPIGQVAR